jgi:hypothetical protein
MFNMFLPRIVEMFLLALRMSTSVRPILSTSY